MIQAGILQRTFSIAGPTLQSTELRLNEGLITEAASTEMGFRVQLATPNAKPVGIRDTSKTEITQLATEKIWSDALQIEGKNDFVKQSVQWVSAQSLRADSWGSYFDHTGYTISQPQAGVTRLAVRSRTLQAIRQSGLTVTQYYEIYEGQPVIRKWVEMGNSGSQWMKVDNLWLDNSLIRKEYQVLTDLTPSEFGVVKTMRWAVYGWAAMPKRRC